ncbi:MAG: hypothetical protein QG599_3307 [Pseudomonadota bacterium]|nr:hypothetical protein [Pseudomonadota bacterium]
MTKPILYPYQHRWLQDPARFKIGMWSRQIGKTFTTTLEIVLDCLDAEVAGQRRRWVLLSRGERQAKEAMLTGIQPALNACAAVYKTQEAACEWAPEFTALEVRLPGGSRITALPANPDTARGFSANVLLDEFAFHQDSRKIWQALFPVISAGHLLRVVSTPNGKGNKFYELMTDPALQPLWSRHEVDIHRAVADGLPRQIAELKAGLNDPDAWAQEYELHWLDEASAWLSYDLIDRCEDDDAGHLQHHNPSSLCYLGVDIGARHDLFVIWVLEAVGDVLWTREVIAKQRISFAEQDALLDDCFQRYRVVRCAMDQSGMGEKPVEDAKRRYGSRIEGVLFTSASKQLMATIAKDAFEDRKVRIPKGVREIREDLHKLQKVTSPTGAPRFVADRDSDGHADRAWALFLALYAADTPSVDVTQIQSAAPREALSAWGGHDHHGAADLTRGW